MIRTVFKLTLPCGERQIRHTASPANDNLNSRSPVGSDDDDYSYFEPDEGFKLTLPCGERRDKDDRHAHDQEFKLTLPCGERRNHSK